MLALVFDWLTRIGHSSCASTTICPKRYLTELFYFEDNEKQGRYDRLLQTFNLWIKTCFPSILFFQLLAKQLLQSYEWELVPGQDLTYKWLPVSRPKNDIQVVFTKIGL